MHPYNIYSRVTVAPFPEKPALVEGDERGT
jgi:hypothetical protein